MFTPVNSGSSNLTYTKISERRSFSTSELDMLEKRPELNHTFSQRKFSLQTKKDWPKLFLVALETFSKERLAAGEKDPQAIVSHFIEEQLVPRTIHPLLSTSDPFSFLHSFLAYKNAERFLETFKDIPDRSKNALQRAIGANGITHLEHALKPENRKNWVHFVEKQFFIHTKALELQKKNIQIPFGFDAEKRIAEIGPGNIVSAFRFFIASDFHKHEAPPFVINGKPIQYPNVQYLPDLERKTTFMQWLINHLNDHLQTVSQYFLEQQASLLCHEPSLPADLKDTLEKLVKKHSTSQDGICAIIRDLHKFSDFTVWAKKELENLLIEKQNPDIDFILNRYIQQQWLNLCEKNIPCFRILQALSNSAYSKAIDYLHNHYFPAMGLEQTFLRRLKSFPTEPMHFELTIDSQTKGFTVTHVKTFQFIEGRTHEHTTLGKIDVHWQLKGNQDSVLFSAKLWCSNPTFSCSLDVCKEILNKITQ